MAKEKKTKEAQEPKEVKEPKEKNAEMKNVFRHKDVLGGFYYDPKKDTFLGEIYGTNKEITFEGNSVTQLKASFICAAQQFLAEREIKRPMEDKPFGGTTTIRMEKVLHRNAVMLAAMEGISLNQFIERGIWLAVEESFNKTTEVKQD
ncbi:MAG: toxin-antitoxin system HicB family antitoxin [Clostridiales bacterium]